MTEVPDQLRDLCNEQIVNELHASHLYLSMAAYLNERGLHGCAEFMRDQSEEEREHAMKFYEHLVDRDARVDIGALDDTPSEWGSVQSVFRDAYQHEQKVTGQIEAIYEAAEDANDRPLENMLDWFVDEQVEEERTFRRILELFEFVDDDGSGLLEIDERLHEAVEAEA
jgi:ferritin